jgi:predicted acetyltransferase
MHRIRPATPDDVQPLAGLWSRAFPGLRPLEHRIAMLETGGVYGGVESAWVAEQGGRMVGAFRAFPLTQQLHGAPLAMLGLASLAVEEGARRQGLGRRLCQAAVRVGRERGDVVSTLYPFRPAFYEALGWGSTGALHAFRFRPEALRPPAGGGEGDTVRRASPAELPAIMAAYERFAREANGPIRRSARVWAHHLEGDAVHAYVTGDDAISGYAIIGFGAPAGPGRERALHIRELVTEHPRATGELLGWVAAQQESWRLVHYDAAPDEHFSHRLRDPRTPGAPPHRPGWAPVARVVAGPMLRILDVQQALEQRRRWGTASPLRFGLEVRDAIVPENDGEFVVDFDGSQATVRRGSARPLLRLPVAVLAQLLAGELDVGQALALDRARQDGEMGAVDALFRTGRCFRLLDEF